MNRQFRFLKTTLVGGILFLLPILLVGAILGKAFAIAHEIVMPLAAHLPVKSMLGLETPRVLAICLLVAFCFLAGVFARTALAAKMIGWLETAVLSNVPGYEFIKSMSEDLLSAQTRHVYPVVLARVEDSWQLAFLVERVEGKDGKEGGHFAVFVPGSPSPQSGSVYFMTEDRIRHTDIASLTVVKCLKRYGLGASAILGGELGGLIPPA